MTTIHMVPDNLVPTYINPQRCGNSSCGCSAVSLKTRQGKADRYLDLVQAVDRARDAKNDKRVNALISAAKKYDEDWRS